MNSLKDIIFYVLQSYPGTNDLTEARIVKIIYLSDWHQALYYRKQISTINWYHDNCGPYSDDIRNTILDNSNLFIIDPPKNLIMIKDKNYYPHLGIIERKSIDHIITISSALNWNEFIKLVYSTYPVSSSSKYSNLDIVAKALEYKPI